LCTQKSRIPVDNPEELLFSELRDMIDELKLYHPASDGQIKLITDKLAKLEANGVILDVQFDQLTGGNGGTASLLIAKLIELEAKYVKEEPTPGQIGFLAQMYLYPEADFEGYGVKRTVPIDDTHFRKLTEEEFIAEVKRNFDKPLASKFLNENKAGFNAWKSTRIKLGQLNYLRTLLERTGAEYDDLNLMMISVEEGSKWIDQLVNEAKNKPEYAPVQQEASHDLPFSIKSVPDAIKVEAKGLIDSLYSIVSQTGVETECEPEQMSDTQIRDYIMYVISNEYIEPEVVTEMISDNQRLQEIFAKDYEEANAESHVEITA